MEKARPVDEWGALIQSKTLKSLNVCFVEPSKTNVTSSYYGFLTSLPLLSGNLNIQHRVGTGSDAGEILFRSSPFDFISLGGEICCQPLCVCLVLMAWQGQWWVSVICQPQDL